MFWTTDHGQIIIWWSQHAWVCQYDSRCRRTIFLIGICRGFIINFSISSLLTTHSSLSGSIFYWSFRLISSRASRDRIRHKLARTESVGAFLEQNPKIPFIPIYLAVHDVETLFGCPLHRLVDFVRVFRSRERAGNRVYSRNRRRDINSGAPDHRGSEGGDGRDPPRDGAAIILMMYVFRFSIGLGHSFSSFY